MWIGLRLRRLRLSFIYGNDFGGSFLTHANAIGNADAVIGIASQIQTRDRTRQFFDARDALFMTDRILRHRMRPAGDVVKHRLGLETHDAVQFSARGVHQGIV